MGKKNNVMCDYLEKPERFADFINGSLYGGKQAILPEQIAERQTVYSKAARNRDILKKVCREGSYILIGVENQDQIHYAMPLRCMEYDVLEYKKQLERLQSEYRGKQREKGNRIKSEEEPAENAGMNRAEFLSGIRKADRLSPVTTIVFYHGEDEYDGCRNLHDMLNFEEGNEIFKQYISNYHINLVTVKDLNENNFQTGIRELIGFMKRRKNRSELQKYCEENWQRMQEMDEDTFDTISIMINRTDFMKQKSDYRQEGGTVNMCQAMEEWKEELLQEGMERGIERGMEALVLDYLEEGMSRERIIEKLQKIFSLDAEKAENYFSKYATCQ
ncbi:MAG: Rpn family recombination-promoting nuclease/putative transposase [Clostridium sp.]|nr:Rpn family recombination-promoting nuclease/putative transposase [Clostridium sp.]